MSTELEGKLVDAVGIMAFGGYASPKGREVFKAMYAEIWMNRRTEKYRVALIPERSNGSWRSWVGYARDWDEAGALAEESNPGWVAHTIGPYVDGSHL